MIKFLVQTFKGKVEHDFSLTLIESVKYQDWVSPGQFEIHYSDLPQITGDYVPIGSVEFVHGFMLMNDMAPPRPINIPFGLMKYSIARRKILVGDESMVTEKMFVKCHNTVKGYTEITSTPPPGFYQMSEIVNFESEWRAFIYNKKLVGLKHYTGDFKVFPSVDSIEFMMENYIEPPIAYTLDVGIVEKSTVPIEVHNFYSCGLYGFDDHRLLPFMFVRWWNEFKEKWFKTKNKQKWLE